MTKNKANKIVLGRDVALEVYVECRWLVPQTMQMQVSSVDRTLIGKIWGAGSALLLEVIPGSDSFKPRACWGELREQLCDRVATEIVADASHALFPEQPDNVAEIVIEWCS